MELDTKTPPYSTGDMTSFAYISARDRWPVIVTGAIDDTYRTVVQCEDGDKQNEGKQIVEELARLKYELQHDRQLTPIRDDGHADVALYNSELEALGTPTWFSVPWLFCECYLYRRVQTSFSLSTHWRAYDVFARQKIRTFRSSRAAVVELAARYRELVEDLRGKKEKKPAAAAGKEGKDDDEAAATAERLLFREMAETCLWGNATDLSLLTTSLTHADLLALQGAEARRKATSGKKVLVDDVDAAYEALRKARDSVGGGKNAAAEDERRVDLVLDNAGFELFVDLVLAGFLLASGLATRVVMHPKAMPWFVSDVVPADFAALLGALSDPRGFFAAPDEDDANREVPETPQPLADKEAADLEFLFEDWAHQHAEGRLILRPNRFWTHPGSFWRMPAEEALWEDLQGSELVVFKGDLNYRKLTGDAMWPPTTPFATAIGPLGPGSGINVLALRTCKADVVVGLADGEDERLRALDDGGGDSGSRKWAWSGKWAVVSFSSGE